MAGNKLKIINKMETITTLETEQGILREHHKRTMSTGKDVSEAIEKVVSEVKPVYTLHSFLL